MRYLMFLNYSIYGTETRGIRWFNLVYHFLWLSLILAHLTNLFVIDLPIAFSADNSLFIWLLLWCITLSVASLCSCGRGRQVAKYVSLLLGSLCELIIAAKYMVTYPPLTPMVIISFVLFIWFMGAALFTKQETRKKYDNTAS